MSEDRDDDDRDPYANAPTPPLRRRPRPYAMPPDQRDSADHRRAERALTDSERRQHASAAAIAVPPAFTEDPDTGPIAMLESVELDARSFHALHRLRSETPDPHALVFKSLELIRQLSHTLKKLEAREESNNKERANQLLDLLNRPPDAATQELREQLAAQGRGLADHDRFLTGQRKVLGWIAGGLISAVLATATFLYSRGVSEGGAAVRMQQLERTVDQLVRRVYPDPFSTPTKGP